jgi:hypothetical protein
LKFKFLGVPQKKLEVYSVLKMCRKYLANTNKQSVQFFVIFFWVDMQAAPPPAALHDVQRACSFAQYVAEAGSWTGRARHLVHSIRHRAAN